MLVETFPELGRLGYAIMRTSCEGGRAKELMVLPMPAGGFSVDYLKNVLGQAKAYLRPVQGDIVLDEQVRGRSFKLFSLITKLF